MPEGPRRRVRIDVEGIPRDWQYDTTFDGGRAGCGEILIDLRMLFRTLDAGTRVLVHNPDGGARIEMPAWCRLSRNELLAASHPYYLIIVKPSEMEA
jgi:tRNA 2-thiouridine synthesizing protein A